MNGCGALSCGERACFVEGRVQMTTIDGLARNGRLRRLL